MVFRYSNALTIEPLGGLCNRMRVIDAGLALSASIHKPLRIIWHQNHLLNCPFERLFEVPDGVSELIPMKLPPALIKPYLKVSRLFFPFFYQKYISRRVSYDLVSNQYDFRQLEEFRSIKITTCYRFHKEKSGYRDFVAVKGVQQWVDANLRHFTANTVGVHIRRTDHVQSKRNSTSERFMALVEQETQRDQNTRFFLATDSAEEQDNFIKRWGDRVIVHEKRSLDRTRPEAIEDALVDLLCLASTQKIIGSFGSSFTETAAEMGHIDLVIA